VSHPVVTHTASGDLSPGDRIEGGYRFQSGCAGARAARTQFQGRRGLVV